jgi:hypothetical protein
MSEGMGRETDVGNPLSLEPDEPAGVDLVRAGHVCVRVQERADKSLALGSRGEGVELSKGRVW